MVMTYELPFFTLEDSCYNLIKMIGCFNMQVERRLVEEMPQIATKPMQINAPNGYKGLCMTRSTRTELKKNKYSQK